MSKLPYGYKAKTIRAFVKVNPGVRPAVVAKELGFNLSLVTRQMKQDNLSPPPCFKTKHVVTLSRENFNYLSREAEVHNVPIPDLIAAIVTDARLDDTNE